MSILDGRSYKNALGLKKTLSGPKKAQRRPYRAQKSPSEGPIGPKKRPIGLNGPLPDSPFLENIELISTETLYILLVYIHTYSSVARRTIYTFRSTRTLPIRLHLDSNDTLKRNKCIFSAAGDRSVCMYEYVCILELKLL